MNTERLKQNILEIRNEISAALLKSNRDEKSVQLIAVTKNVDAELTKACALAGLHTLAENRPQQLLIKQESFIGHIKKATVQWHLIGQLQTNKINAILGKTELIHSISSLKLAQALDMRSERESLKTEILLQVNVSGEISKDGFSPDEILTEVEAIKKLQHISVKGLMTIAPANRDDETLRKVFRNCRLLRDKLEPIFGKLPELSMGMSQDFSIAIEEGATMVRIGSKLFKGVSV